MDQVLTVLLSTGMVVGGLVGFCLHNLLPTETDIDREGGERDGGRERETDRQTDRQSD